MRYYEIRPSSALAAYINCFWVLEEADVNVEPDPVFPDGSLELLFYLRGTSERVALGDSRVAANPCLELAGQLTRPYGIRWAPGVCLVGVRFFPRTFARFGPPGLIISTYNLL
ncbi:MAG: hypothetical protein H7Z21_15965 [Hymenobacter sp.]|nr:hypothetical protein [Hymenobacter sp.]